MTDLASRAQAREEVAEGMFLAYWECQPVEAWEDEEESYRESWRRVADVALDPEVFARLAGLLGYVKADGGHWFVRRDGITYPNVFVDEATARLWARDFADQGAGCVFVRRCTADVEVVTDAEQ